MSAAIAVLLFIASFWSGMYVQRNPWIYSSDFNPEEVAKQSNTDTAVQPKHGDHRDSKPQQLICLEHECCRKRYAEEFDNIRSAATDGSRRSAEEGSGLFYKPSNSRCTDTSSVSVQGS
jgi:hypothetical protein